MQAVSSYRVNPVYWLLWVNPVYCTAYSIRYLIRRNPVSLNPAYSLYSLYTASLSISSLWSLYPYSIRVILWPILYAFSMVTLWLAYSLLSLVYPMPYPLGYPFPVFLSSSSPLPFSLVYRRYRYAIRLTRNGDYFA